jgi:hypothetical protein
VRKKQSRLKNRPITYTTQAHEDSERGYPLPSISGDDSGLSRPCRRWEGVSESKGYFPALVAEGGINITQDSKALTSTSTQVRARTLGHITSLL